MLFLLVFAFLFAFAASEEHADKVCIYDYNHSCSVDLGALQSTCPGIKDHRRAVLYLLHEKRLGEARESLVLLFANVMSMWRYPIIMFVDEVLNRTAATEFFGKHLTPHQHCLVQFVAMRFAFPPGYNSTKALEKGVAYQHAYPNYHHMCAFWFSNVYHYIRDLQYYWRLDTDSFIRSPAKQDYFDYMHQNGIKYAYRMNSTDPPFVTGGLWCFIIDYLKENGLPLPARYLSHKFDCKSAVVDIYYNNFEIAHVRSFTANPRMKHFIARVVDSHNIYTQRWGDAPLRTFAVNLFFEEEEVHQICDIQYNHQTDAPLC